MYNHLTIQYILLDCLLHNAISSFYLCDVLHMKSHRLINRWWKITVIISLLTFLLGNAVLSVPPYARLPLASYIYTAVNLTVLLVLAVFFFSGYITVKIIAVLSLAAVDLLALMVSRQFLSSLFSADAIAAAPAAVMEIISIPFQTMIFLTLSILIISFRKIAIHRLKHNELFLYIILPLYQLLLFCISLNTYKSPDEATFTMGNFIVFLNIIVDFIMIFSIDNLIEKIEVEENLAALYIQRQTELEYYQLTQKHMESMKNMKQEFTSHLQAIRSSLQSADDSDRLPGLVEKSRDCLSKNALPRYCEDEIVNAVLTIKKQVATEKSIPMDINVRVPAGLSVSEIDLCSLFCNLLDNAIEACDKISGPRKYITVKANVSGGFLIVKTENAYVTPVLLEHGIFKTSKENTDDHGYGLKLIERITSKYHGQLTIHHPDNIFTASAALLLPTVDEAVS